MTLTFWHPQRESNSQLTLMRGLLYPFNYEGIYIKYSIKQTDIKKISLFGIQLDAQNNRCVRIVFTLYTKPAKKSIIFSAEKTLYIYWIKTKPAAGSQPVTGLQ